MLASQANQSKTSGFTIGNFSIKYEQLLQEKEKNQPLQLELIIKLGLAKPIPLVELMSIIEMNFLKMKGSFLKALCIRLIHRVN